MAIVIKKRSPIPPPPKTGKSPWAATGAYKSPAALPEGTVPKECTACGHIYMQPCNGDAKCPNMVFLASQSKGLKASG